MKIELGNYYLQANGCITKIVSDSLTDMNETIYWSSDSNSYYSDGRYWKGSDSEFDLICEVPTEKYKRFIEELMHE